MNVECLTPGGKVVPLYTTAEEKKGILDSSGHMRHWNFQATACHLCGIKNSEIEGLLLQCGKCKVTYYCSKKCFNDDLIAHRDYCKTANCRNQPRAGPEVRRRGDDGYNEAEALERIAKQDRAAAEQKRIEWQREREEKKLARQRERQEARAEAERIRREEEEERRRQEEEERQAIEAKRLEEDRLALEAARAEAERIRREKIELLAKEEEERQRALEEAKRKEEEMRLKAEEEARLAAEKEAARLKAEEEARLAAEQEAARLKAEEEARLAAEQEAARLKAEEEARLAAEQEAARLKAEEEARLAAEQEAARLQAEEEARLAAEQEAARLQAEEEARLAAEQEAARLQAEEEEDDERRRKETEAEMEESEDEEESRRRSNRNKIDEEEEANRRRLKVGDGEIPEYNWSPEIVELDEAETIKRTYRWAVPSWVLKSPLKRTELGKVAKEQGSLASNPKEKFKANSNVPVWAVTKPLRCPQNKTDDDIDSTKDNHNVEPASRRFSSLV